MIERKNIFNYSIYTQVKYSVIILLILCISSISAQTNKSTLFYGGDGTVSNPYQISTAEDLADLATLVNAGGNASLNTYYIVINDIDLSDYTLGEGWVPIGKIDIVTDDCRFRGNFDGNGKIISNLFINRREDYQGLFGCILGATIKNLSLENCDVIGNESVGGVAGDVTVSNVTNCHASGVVTGGFKTGGVLGFGNNSTIANCSSACNVTGNSDIGGLAGKALHTPMTNCHASGNVNGINCIGGLTGNLVWAPHTNCYATGDVTGSDDVGGLAGNSSASSSKTNCYATGNVIGDNNVGGLVGNNSGSASILNCYATGDVTATGSTIGGLAGYNDLSIIENCYATGSVSGADNVGGLVGNNVGDVSNCRAFNCKVEATGIAVGRIAGSVILGSTLTGNYGYNQMELWTNGVIITTLTPPPAHNNMHGADITYASAPPQAKVCKAIFYANNVYCESLNDTTFCDKVVHFQAVIDGFNLAQDTIKWFLDGDEDEDVRNLLQWSKPFDSGEHHISIVMQVLFGNGEMLSISGILHVRVFWTQIKNYRR